MPESTVDFPVPLGAAHAIPDPVSTARAAASIIRK
jgi:hypothetical protein